LICDNGGGTLHIGEGTFNETLATRAGCTIAIAGAGVDKTIIDCTVVSALPGPPVCWGIGNLPPGFGPNNVGTRIRDLTVKCDDPDQCDDIGVGATNSVDSKLSNIKVKGFRVGIETINNQNLGISHNVVEYQEPGEALSGVGIVAVGSSGVNIHHNSVRDAFVLLRVINLTTDAEIHHNTLIGGNNGIQVIGVSGFSVGHNTIQNIFPDFIPPKDSFGAMIFLGAQNGIALHNQTCDVSGLPNASVMGNSTNIKFNKNSFLGFDLPPYLGETLENFDCDNEGICFAPETDSSAVRFLKGNDFDPSGSCPNP